MYSFANVIPDTGEVSLSDTWADLEIPLDGDGFIESQTYLKGCFGQFFKLKSKFRKLKIILSIGGWTYSNNLRQGISTLDRRRTFARSAVDILKNLGLDGLDIDWEYPDNPEDSLNFVDLLRQIRLELDSYALRVGLPRDQFELSVAAPAGPIQYQRFRIKDMDQYITFWNIMCYDYAGPWSITAQFHSNLFQGDISTDSSIKYYINSGVASQKIVMGIPIYGRSFANTDGLGKAFSGIGRGSWEAGTYDYKTLPLPGSQESVDLKAVSVSCYDPKSKILVTYDNEKTVKEKTTYLQKNGLGGGMWWESSADFPSSSNKSLVSTFSRIIGTQNLDQKQNCLSYPESGYDNIKNINFTFKYPSGNSTMRSSVQNSSIDTSAETSTNEFVFSNETNNHSDTNSFSLESPNYNKKNS